MDRLFGVSPDALEMVVFSVTIDVCFEPLTECIYDADADAVESAGHFIAVAVEFSACMEGREDDLERAFFRIFVLLYRNSSSVVLYSAASIGMDVDGDAVAVSGHGLVDGVVDDLVNEVVETAGAPVADVHFGAFLDGLEATENLDVTCVVAMILHSVPTFAIRSNNDCKYFDSI